MTWKPIVGKFVDIAGFKAHVDGLMFTGWQPSFVVVHNTSEPSLATYADWRAHPERHGGWTPEKWGSNLAGYYAGLGWSSGPHAFVCPDGILLFSPLTAPGTHSPAWNSRTLGIETVGEFEREPFAGSPSEANLVAVLGILHARLGLDPAAYLFGVRGLHFHKEDPKTTHKQCPGRNVIKEKLVAAVVDYIERAHGGDHHEVPAEAHTAPPPPTVPTAPPATYTLHGRMSVFGGPDDHGVSAIEGLALVEPNEVGKFAGLFLPSQPPHTTGLARRLDPSAHYIACRWDYGRTPKGFLQRSSVKVSANGRTVEARPVDWGPAVATGRVADLSPGLAAALGLKTDDVCDIEIPLPRSGDA